MKIVGLKTSHRKPKYAKESKVEAEQLGAVYELP